MPSARASVWRGSALPGSTKAGCSSAIGIATNPDDMQLIIATHLSQPDGAGACDGQHGISLAISAEAISMEAIAVSAAISTALMW